jgi:hypothetical protein
MWKWWKARMRRKSLNSSFYFFITRQLKTVIIISLSS